MVGRVHTTAEGNIPFTLEEEAEWDAKEALSLLPVVPEKIERLQARLVLIDSGKWNLIQPAIDSIEDDIMRAKAQAYFEDAMYWHRNDQFVLMLAPVIGLNSAETDALFIAAKDL